jgi:hypothetical protein
MVCVSTPDQLEAEFFDGFPISGNNDYFISKDGANFISMVDGLDKKETGFLNCTGLVVCGIDKVTGKNISFMTHQDSIQLFMLGGKADFVMHLETQLNEIKDQCRPGTIDAVVVGGILDSGFETDEGIYKKDYLESLKLLSREVDNVLGFDPVVVNGPKIDATDSWDNFYFSTEERKAYLIRQRVNNMKDFRAGEGGKIFDSGKKS